MRSLHFFEENVRVEKEIEALENGDFEGFLKLVEASGNSSWKWLQNICVPGVAEEQPMAICLALSEYFIRTHGKGACRLHGGGFAGVIQAFIPNELADEYIDFMNTSLNGGKDGKNNVYKMTIRPLGTIEIC
jgi:galactokinase